MGLWCRLGLHYWPEEQFKPSEEGEAFCKNNCGTKGIRKIKSVGFIEGPVWYPITWFPKSFVVVLLVGLVLLAIWRFGT